MTAITFRFFTTTLLWFSCLPTNDVVAVRISDVRLIGHHQDSNGRTGFVQVLHSGIWKSVCNKGNEPDDRSWGTPEASVVCRQLGFHGGWVLASSNKIHVDNVPHQAIDDFRCRGDETSLERCYYDRFRRYARSGCGINNLAGARCFASYEVRLVGGTKPNAGRVQIRYDNNIWTNVCFNTKNGNSDGRHLMSNSSGRDWGFNEVQVVCRELGYPGAVMKQRGGYGNGEGQFYNDGFSCFGNEQNLKQCLSNTPARVPKHQRYICGPRNEAVAICAEPGYVGCYTYNRQLPSSVLFDRFESQRMKVRLCKDHCRSHTEHMFAALYDGHVCYCGTKDFTLHVKARRLSDTKCRDPCGGNDHEICGGYNTLSVHDVEGGICLDPFNKSRSYYFGDIVENIECDAGYDVHGESSVQCIMGDSGNDTKWSGRFPQCREQNTKEQKGTSTLYTHALIALWISIGCVCSLVITMVVVAECTLRRRCNKQASKLLLSTALSTLSSDPQKSKILPPSSEPLYETIIADNDSLHSTSCSLKKQEHTSTFASKYAQMRNLKWTRGSSRCYDNNDQRRALFRHSDDDVVGYIIRTKL